MEIDSFQKLCKFWSVADAKSFAEAIGFSINKDVVNFLGRGRVDKYQPKYDNWKQYGPLYFMDDMR